MKKFLVGLLTVALAASMLVGCGKKEEKKKADNSLKDVQSKKELVLGLDSSFPPMGFTDKKDNIVGFDIDLAKEVTKRMGIKLKLQPINWNSKEQELNTEKVDCLWNGVTYSKARAKEMLCSESYMDNHQVLIVPANSKIKSLKDITKDTEVGIQSGSTAADAADSVKELKNSKIKLLADNVQILNDLGHGLDAAVMDEVVAKYYTKKDAGKYKVLEFKDIKLDIVKNLVTGETSKTGLPTSNVLYYELENDAWCCVRPSGTEPKIKLYMGVKADSMDKAESDLEKLKEAMSALVK